MNGPCLRFTVTPLLLLAAFAFSMPPAAFAQNSAYGHWVNDPNNIATPVFVYDPPPAGFNPLTASDVELEQYGFAPRPPRNDSARYSVWERHATAKRITPQVTPTNIYNGPARNVKIGQLVKNTAQGNTYSTTTDNWSGYVVTNVKGTFAQNYSTIQAQWTIPAVQQAPGTGTCGASSQWVGFDGFGGSDVLQAGTEANALCPGAAYYAWVEWYPYAQSRISLPVGPGDSMQLEVWYTTSSPYGHAQFLNDVTRQSAAFGFNPPSGTTYLGNSAEWIMERTAINGSLVNLPNYAYMFFSGASATPFDFGPVYWPSSVPAGASIYQVNMTCPPWNPSSSCTGTTTISYAEAVLGPDTFLVYASGPAN